MSLVDIHRFQRKVNVEGSIASAVDSSAIYDLSPFHRLSRSTYVRKSEFKVKLEQSGEKGVASMSIPLFDEIDKATIKDSGMPYVHIAAVVVQISCLFDKEKAENMKGTFALFDTLFDNLDDNLIRACRFEFENGRAACCFKLDFSICANDAMSGRPVIPYVRVEGANIRSGLHGFSVSLGTIFSVNKTEFPSVPLKIEDNFIDIVGSDLMNKEELLKKERRDLEFACMYKTNLPSPKIKQIKRGRKAPIRVRDYSFRSSCKSSIEDGCHKERERCDEERSNFSADSEVQTSDASRHSLRRSNSAIHSGIHLRKHSSEGSFKFNGMGGHRGSNGPLYSGSGWGSLHKELGGTSSGGREQGNEGCLFQTEGKLPSNDYEPDSAA
ncbi:movement protein [Trichosanthes tepovirus A]|nr:movement protein [Trichosanthes tepovirus A]